VAEGTARFALPESGLLDVRPDRGPAMKDTGYSGDALN